EPTFFAKKVFAMISNNHHNDGHLAVWIPAAPGEQAALIKADPKTYYYPPYVGKAGWVGIELDQIGDEELAVHLRDAWDLIKPKKPRRKGGGMKRAHISEIFDLGSSAEPTNIRKNKDAMIGEAIASQRKFNRS